MKKVLAVSLVLNGVLALGLLWNRQVVHASAGPVGNGDVNGDGVIDISDAVYLISSLFLGGQAPKAIVHPLPTTSQTKCYDNAGTEIDCASAEFPGQDGFYQTGCPNEGRFVDNGDRTVTDNCTGLVWQKETADVNGDGTIDDRDRLNWQNALKYCDTMSFAGHDDWRLPNVRELQSIVDYERFDPAIDPVFGALSDWYWSSSSFLSTADVWHGNFLGGFVSLDYFGKDYLVFVRAVRTAP